MWILINIYGLIILQGSFCFWHVSTISMICLSSIYLMGVTAFVRNLSSYTTLHRCSSFRRSSSTVIYRGLPVLSAFFMDSAYSSLKLSGSTISMQVLCSFSTSWYTRGLTLIWSTINLRGGRSMEFGCSAYFCWLEIVRIICLWDLIDQIIYHLYLILCYPNKKGIEVLWLSLSFFGWGQVISVRSNHFWQQKHFDDFLFSKNKIQKF